MKPLLEYIDYREYLKDFYEFRKSEHAFFSYRLFGAKVGIDASYLAKVLMKTRHLADSSIERVATFCGHTEEERAYFENLVRFAKARGQKESRVYFEKLLNLKNVRARKVLESQYEFYRSWHHTAIRSLLEFYDFSGNYRALAEQLDPPISPKQAKASIKLLEQLNLIAPDEHGRYRLTETAITTGPEWRSLAVQNFQEETIRLSAESLQRHPRETRDISTITMNISAVDFEEIRSRVAEFRSSIIKYVNQSPEPDRVYQLNMQLIPLSRLPEEKK